ncbi:YaaA family protein [Sulfurospirillum barnesii]|uniref:YaaA family protein n=1 Tax=Sulfurospirillum barnesii (strain ATCC 700032 / DSM 10660 / SES-3) TaxID=760154 RepID=I3XUS4_SULBS|nr:YaaA family protein [Sulfurospirillum barnesii]AFL67698.1 hypothetical protein Sulba_0374 [Sulfurospirillum barnesii SES-3]
MKILFSPSETKSNTITSGPLSDESFIFPHLYEKRLDILNAYQSYIEKSPLLLLQKLFGYKDEEKTRLHATINLFTSFTCKAIERYTGVAYQYLDFKTLDAPSQSFLENNVMIFSNLFGPLLGKDFIPEYKLKQGESFNGLDIETFYKKNFTDAIDAWCGDELILDLRAGFYEKFYTLKQPYITMKFLKNGKNVSHFAKAYRGTVLRDIAYHRPSTEKEFQKIPFAGLKLKEILLFKYKQEYIFESID